MTAVPVALSREGRKTPMDGAWTFEMMCSPRSVTRTVSASVLPSEPGAPLGHRSTVWRGAPAARESRALLIDGTPDQSIIVQRIRRQTPLRVGCHQQRKSGRRPVRGAHPVHGDRGRFGHFFPNPVGRLALARLVDDTMLDV